MPNTPVDTDDNDFVLKHRIAGAAFLLFFGALVLPLLVLLKLVIPMMIKRRKQRS